jgi:hypothetical protein
MQKNPQAKQFPGNFTFTAGKAEELERTARFPPQAGMRPNPHG